MKTYIMLEIAISSIGGSQSYTAAKIQRLKAHGWNGIVFSGNPDGAIQISELKGYESNRFYELLLDPNLVSARKRIQIVKSIAEFARNSDECIIESGNHILALWGELVAKELHARNFVYLLGERNNLVPECYLPFFRFKLSRHELAGIRQESIPALFRNDGTVPENNNLGLRAFTLPSVADTTVDCIESLPTNRITIASIGRLDKPCVKSIADGLYRMISNHPFQKFNLVFIGSSEEKFAEDSIKSKFENLANVNLVLAGALFPMPTALFQKTNLFVSSAGSAFQSYNQDRTTISIDANDGYAIGVLGYTTLNRLYRVDEPKTDIAELAEKVLFTDYLSAFQYVPAIVDRDKLFQAHLDFMNGFEKELSYFDISKIKYPLKDQIKRGLFLVFGKKFAAFLRWIYIRKTKKKKHGK